MNSLRTTVSAAAKATAATIRRKEWWLPAAAIGVTQLAITVALPLFAVLRFGLWQGFGAMFSPFNEQSLTRLLLPAVALLAACLELAILAQFTIELTRLVRRRQSRRLR